MTGQQHAYCLILGFSVLIPSYLLKWLPTGMDFLTRRLSIEDGARQHNEEAGVSDDEDSDEGGEDHHQQQKEGKILSLYNKVAQGKPAEKPKKSKFGKASALFGQSHLYFNKDTAH